MSPITTVLLIILVLFLILYFVSNISPERKFRKEECPRGGNHRIYYKSFGITHQEITCTKCGKSTIIEK